MRQLARLLAVCDVQADVRLVALAPLLQERIAEALSRPVAVDPESLRRAAEVFAQIGVTWAADGATALGLQGISVGEGPAFAVVDDEPFRTFLYRKQVKALDRFGGYTAMNLGAPRAVIDADVARGPVLVFGVGFLRLRVVDALPAVQRLALDSGLEVPVLGVLDVAQAHPDITEVVQGVLEQMR